MGKSTSASTGVTTPFGSGFGEKSRFESWIDFLAGKTAPIPKAIIDVGKGQNFEGKKPIIGSITKGLTVPISIQNFLKIDDKPNGADWTQKTSAEMKEFREKVGEDEFKKANELYNQQYTDWLKEMRNNTEFKSLPDEDKETVVSKKKESLKKAIFNQYKFKPTPNAKAKSLPTF